MNKAKVAVASTPKASAPDEKIPLSKNNDPFFYYNIASVQDATSFSTILDSRIEDLITK
jgi:hypothetical protein